MNLSISTRPDSWRSTGLIIPVFADAVPLKELTRFKGLSWLGQSSAFADLGTDPGAITLCHAPRGNGKAAAPISRVVAVGLGKRKDCTMEIFRRAVTGAVRYCRERQIAAPGLCLPALEWLAEMLDLSEEVLLEESVLGVSLAAYEYDAFRSPGTGRGKKAPFVFSGLNLLAEKRLPTVFKSAISKAEGLASGIYLARDLANGPANAVTPNTMSDTARALAAKYGFECRVLGRAEMEKLGMGAILAVAKGSAQEPRFIVLEYTPAGRYRSPLIFVGKGITFDSGGISLKPSAGMERMKTDMAGAAAVLGVFEAIGRNPGLVKNRVIGLVPCTENMPGGNATRPGDVITTMKGVTVEVVNTDAEGRLILCDALAYAQKEWSPSAVVDIATLTGACVVALGKYAAGLFCDHTPLRNTLLTLGDSTGDTCWHLPLWEKLRDGLKSETADTMNSGPREGGAISAALFLKLFIEDGLPWAHIDMAATGHSSKPTDTGPAGATGFGVRILYELAKEGVLKEK